MSSNSGWAAEAKKDPKGAAKQGLNYLKDRTLHQHSKNDERVYQLINIIPQCSPVKSWICAILNVLISGLGTMVASCSNGNVNVTQLFVGLAQFLTSIYLVGWLHSIYWGYLLVKNAKGDHVDELVEVGADVVQTGSNKAKQAGYR